MIDRAGIAARVRALLAIRSSHDLVEAANRLNVSESSLRMSIDELAPHPTIEVLSAVVAHFGADPNWVLTGVYDSAQHRRVLEGTPATISATVRELITPRETPAVVVPPIRSPEPPDSHVGPDAGD